MNTKSSVKTLMGVTPEILQEAYDRDHYLILGTGGDINEWVEGYVNMLTAKDIGVPEKVYHLTGEQLNVYAEKDGLEIDPGRALPSTLTCLMFPLEGLDVGKLAILKIQQQDHWFSDVIDGIKG